MCKHETKNCPRCNTVFECKSGTITQCQCYGIPLTNELKVYIEGRYTDCLCRDCLIYLQLELNLFKERYFFK
ncbi:MAG: cysteine-rich CWC family protein [Bacteroidota bacterium]|nr:cysteine-rich CWC family protein [Bacteroidota bacterium]